VSDVGDADASTERPRPRFHARFLSARGLELALPQLRLLAAPGGVAPGARRRQRLRALRRVEALRLLASQLSFLGAREAGDALQLLLGVEARAEARAAAAHASGGTRASPTFLRAAPPLRAPVPPPVGAARAAELLRGGARLSDLPRGAALPGRTLFRDTPGRRLPPLLRELKS
jgi:hypothetical protein